MANTNNKGKNYNNKSRTKMDKKKWTKNWQNIRKKLEIWRKWTKLKMWRKLFKLEKIENWTKLKIGQNWKLDKIKSCTKSQSWTKLKIGTKLEIGQNHKVGQNWKLGQNWKKSDWLRYPDSKISMICVYIIVVDS